MKHFLPLLLVLLTTGCATAPAAREASVREAMNGFMTALNALDAERMAAYFADDVTAFVSTTQPDRIDGKPAVVEIFRKYVETTRRDTACAELVPEDLAVNAGGDVGIATFNIRREGTVARRTFIFQNRGGRWRIVHFHASNVSFQR